MNSRIYEGSDVFKADQLSRMLEIKVPPFVKGRISPQVQGGVTIEYDEDWTPLNCRVLRERELIWNLGGIMLPAPCATTWWVPYNLEAIMRYGHSVNTDIPEDPNEAEFPQSPGLIESSFGSSQGQILKCWPPHCGLEVIPADHLRRQACRRHGQDQPLAMHPRSALTLQPS
jgi:hypothetical protein